MTETPPAGQRVQRAFAALGLVVASTVVFLLVAETALRVWDAARGNAPFFEPDPVTDLYASHPYLPVVLKPGTDYRDNDTAGHIDSLGLRGPEFAAKKPAGTYRVICVGGSTTFGAGIIGDEKTYPARLEAHLRETWPDRNTEVLNAGVPGYTTAEDVIYLSLRLIDFSPDVVVLYEGYNDFKPNRYPGFRSDYAHWRDRAVAPHRSPLERWRLYTKLRGLLRRGGGDTTRVKDPGSGRPLRRYDSVGEEGLETFRRNLSTMIATARRAGATVVLATYAHPCTEENLRNRPDLFRYLPAYLPNLTFAGVLDAFERYNDAIREVAATDDAILADAARALPPDPDLFVDHVHFSARGADAFARVVADAILASEAASSDAGSGPGLATRSR